MCVYTVVCCLWGKKKEKEYLAHVFQTQVDKMDIKTKNKTTTIATTTTTTTYTTKITTTTTCFFSVSARVFSGVLCQVATRRKGYIAPLKGALEGLVASVCSGVEC